MLRRRTSFLFLHIFISTFFLIVAPHLSFAKEVTYNVLAVNGSDTQKEKDIDVLLPPELGIQDIIETDGLELKYDVNEKAYRVQGKVELGPKESKTYRVIVKDVWVITPQQVKDIKIQVDQSINRIRKPEFVPMAEARREELLTRLDFLVQEQAKHADNVQKRVDGFRAYSEEFKDIREKALSVSYWRTQPPEKENAEVITFTLEVENPTDSELTVSPAHYLPSEIKPEHLVEYEGFDLKYDAFKKSFYLEREETLQPKEIRKYGISVLDVWSIKQQDIDNIRIRANDVYKQVETSIYQDSALYLIKSIKEKLERVEASQAIEWGMAEHISAFRKNSIDYESAQRDAEQLEDLLTALRENLERSKLKNVLEKVEKIKSLANVADSIFGTKPSKKDSWRVILGIVVFVGLITFVHFAIWGKRSKEAKLKDISDQTAEEQQEAQEKEED